MGGVLSMIKYSGLKSANPVEENEQSRYGMEFLVFQLGMDEYAVAISKIKEICQPNKLIHINNAPEFVAGAILFQEAIIPLIDMGFLFNIKKNTKVHTPMIIILNLERYGNLGIIVDSVSDVIKLNSSQIKSTPPLTATIKNIYFTGIGVIDNRTILIVDVEKLLSPKELKEIDPTVLIKSD